MARGVAHASTPSLALRPPSPPTLFSLLQVKQGVATKQTALLSKLNASADPNVPTTVTTAPNGTSTVTCKRNQQCFARGGITFASLATLAPTLAIASTPWTDTTTNIMTLSAIPYVVGSVDATSISPEGSVLVVTTDDKYRKFRGNGLPSTPMGIFPVQVGTAAYPYYAALPAGKDPATGQDYVPNNAASIYIAPYNLTSDLPLKPVASGFYPVNSLIIGITLTGAVWHAEIAADSNDVWYNPTNALPLDNCWGHPYANQQHLHGGYSWKW